MSDKESQADEVLALQSIFSEEEFSSTNEDGVFCLQFYAFITLPEDFKIVFRNLNESENDMANEQIIKVRYLPPIEMYIKLPQDYPSVSPPLFQLCCSWLSYEMLEKICRELDRLWVENKGSEILFIWTQFLKEECLNFLEITDKLDLSGKYTRELEQIKNNLTKRSSRNNPGEQNTLVESVSSNDAADNCYIEKRLSDSVVVGNTLEKCDSDAMNSVKPAQETSDYSKNKNFKSYGNNRRQYNSYSSEKHSSSFSSESERVYHTNNRRQTYEKRRPNYDKKKENESFDRTGGSCDRRKFPFEKRHTGVTTKQFNLDTNKCETTAVSSPSSSNQTEGSHNTRKVLYDKNRKFRNDGSDMYNNTRTYGTSEFVNSKYTSFPRRRFRYAPKSGSKTTFDVCKQKEKSEKETTENRIDNKVVSDKSDSSFSNEKQVNTPSVVNNVNRSFSTEVPNSCSQESNDKLSISSVNSINNTRHTSVSACSTDAGKMLPKSGLRRVYDKRIRRPKQHKKHLHEVIKDYDRERSKTEFGRNIFTCNICFANKLGIRCTQFKPCDHVFCRDCISGYIEVRIQEGTVQSINCPEHKCESEAYPSQVRELVSPELFARYDSILLSSTLDTMGDIVYCPRPSCQYPVSKEEGEKMAMCPACKYVFCIYCKMVYHGVEPCRLKNEEKLALVKEYQSADKETKSRLEQRYGKSLLTSLVENHMSETWISNNSQSCPNCNAAIEKSDGCNKMVCWKCNTFFCWLCGTRLDPLAPYRHYYDTNSRCNNRLFEGLIVEGNDSDNEENVPFDNEEDHDVLAFEMGYNMFVINLHLEPELENHLLVRIDNVD